METAGSQKGLAQGPPARWAFPALPVEAEGLAGLLLL